MGLISLVHAPQAIGAAARQELTGEMAIETRARVRTQLDVPVLRSDHGLTHPATATRRLSRAPRAATGWSRAQSTLRVNADATAIDDARGHLALNVAAAGATFSVEPASGKLLYFDASGVPSTTETATPRRASRRGVQRGDPAPDEAARRRAACHRRCPVAAGSSIAAAGAVRVCAAALSQWYTPAMHFGSAWAVGCEHAAALNGQACCAAA